MQNAQYPNPRAPGAAAAPLGAILAGGRSVRFGSPKQRAVLRGRPLLEWVTAAVRDAGIEPVLVGGVAPSTAAGAVRWRPDEAPAGPLGGILTALRWARDEGRAGAVCVACDTPFLAPALLAALAERLDGEADVVAPASPGPLGVEPLCAAYHLQAIDTIERRIREGRLSLGSLLSELRMLRLPVHEVACFGDPELLFMNVNTPADHARAAGTAHPSGEGSGS